MYLIKKGTKFKKDFKRIINDKSKKEDLSKILLILMNGEKLQKKYNDHELKGDYSGFRECHIRPDLLLVYKIYENELILSLLRVGTHSELF